MKNLKDEIKKSDTTITGLAKEYGVTRQMMYNYIDMYNKCEYNKIRGDICKNFNKIMNKETNVENTTSFNNEIREIHNEINKIKFLNLIISDKIEDYRKRKGMDAVIDTDGKYVEKCYDTEITTLEGMKDDNDEKIGKLKDDVKKTLAKYNGRIDEPIDQQIAKLTADGMYGGPSWSRSIQNLKTLCVADSGNYMVITDDPNGMKTMLKLYAIIDGVRELIAKYDFKENERFIKFSLIPKLSYYYEVIQYGMDSGYTSGILELKNFEEPYIKN